MPLTGEIGCGFTARESHGREQRIKPQLFLEENCSSRRVSFTVRVVAYQHTHLSLCGR
jgi:hypothetical protein